MPNLSVTIRNFSTVVRRQKQVMTEENFLPGGGGGAAPVTAAEWSSEFRRTRSLNRRFFQKSLRESSHLYKTKQRLPERDWLGMHNMKQRFEFSFLQRVSLRKWFDSMDADGSGDISINELTDALLSTGTASCAAVASHDEGFGWEILPS